MYFSLFRIFLHRLRFYLTFSGILSSIVVIMEKQAFLVFTFLRKRSTTHQYKKRTLTEKEGNL